jgi:hypothetical protein
MGLSPEKRKALSQLVGSDTAQRIEQSISEKDASAEMSGKRFKSIDAVDESFIDIITSALKESTESSFTETAEKCTPGTKDGKYRATKAEEEDMEDDEEDDMEDDEEDDGGDFLLTRKEMDMIATTVAKKLSSEMKGMYRKKSTDTGMESTFKEWTNDSVELSEMIVQHLEDINTRLKAFESVIGVGHTPSQSRSNVVSVKDKGLSTVEDSIINWLSQ